MLMVLKKHIVMNWLSPMRLRRLLTAKYVQGQIEYGWQRLCSSCYWRVGVLMGAVAKSSWWCRVWSQKESCCGETSWDGGWRCRQSCAARPSEVGGMAADLALAMFRALVWKMLSRMHFVHTPRSFWGKRRSVASLCRETNDPNAYAVKLLCSIEEK